MFFRLFINLIKHIFYDTGQSSAHSQYVITNALILMRKKYRQIRNSTHITWKSFFILLLSTNMLVFRSMLRSVMIYIWGIGCGLASVSLLCESGIDWLQLALAEAILLLICNEIWGRVLFISALISGVPKMLRKEPASDKNGIPFYRLTSPILLIIPHLLFGIIVLLHQLCPEDVENLLGATPSASLFAGMFVGVAIVWLCCMIKPIPIFTMEYVLSSIFEPELTCQSVDTSSEKTPEQPGIPPQADENGILYRGKPELRVMNAYMRRDIGIGIAFCLLALLIALILYSGEIQAAPGSDPALLYAAGLVMAVLGVIFGAFGIKMLLSPRRWRQKLRRQEYVITPTEAQILDVGKVIRRYPIDHTLNLNSEHISRDIGNIYMMNDSKTSGFLKKVFGNKLQITDEQKNASARMGFYHIAGASSVYKLLDDLRKANSVSTLQDSSKAHNIR